MTDHAQLDPRPGPDGEIAVEAWVRTSADRTEAMQPLVSQWRPAETPVFSAYDATHTGGLLCAGHYGAVFDGRHVSPARSTTVRSAPSGAATAFTATSSAATPTPTSTIPRPGRPSTRATPTA